MDDANAAFIKCIEGNDLNAVVRLLKSGVNVNADFGVHVLKLSIENKNWDMVFVLLEHGADIHAYNDYALRLSAASGRADIVTALLGLGADINAGKGIGICSALELSVKHNHASVVTVLLRANVDIHADNDYALRLSMQFRYLEIMKVLLEYGANVQCNNRQILKTIRDNFDKRVADIIMPYCNCDDYEYFPAAYVATRIISTKNAQKI